MTMALLSSPAARTGRDRRGAALLMTLIAIVVLSLLSLAGVLSATQEFRAGRNSLVEQRAFAVAEYGLNSEIARWPRNRNLPPPNGLAYGAIDSSSVFVAQGDTARVKVTRLNDNTFWVVSVGRASIGNRALESQRKTHMLVRIAYPTINPGGAIVTAGNITVTGSALITGNNTDPAGWEQCPQIAGRDTFALSVAPDMQATIQNPHGVTGGVNQDPAAADSNTYVRFGTETWNSLAANADKKIPGGTIYPEPVGSLTTCDRSVITNWGEPLRTAFGLALGCKDYFPIIYSSGNLSVGRGRGQGILLVNGDLRIEGNFHWSGLIIVRDDIVKGNGTTLIWGSVMSRNANILDPSVINGNSTFQWSKCAVESALRGSAILTRTKERSWAQLY
jgi:hypothetical protein